MAEPGSLTTKMMSLMPESSKLHVAMTIFQFGYAGNHVILRAALNMGISKLVFPVYRNLIALLLMAPFAYFMEKKDRPALNISFLMQFFLLGFVGIASNQIFYLLGLDNTSPTFASATENAVPAVTFILAALIRLEQVHLNRKDGLAKVLGTLTSFVGASVITLYKGPSIYKPNSSPNQSELLFSIGNANAKSWTLGCIASLGHCLCWSSWIVLQAIFLKNFPAPFSVYSFTCFFGSLQLLAVAAYVERDPQTWQVHSSVELFSLLYAGMVVSGIGFAIQIWVIQRGGPVFVSGYLPLQTMLVAVTASIALGEEFYLGGIIGAALIIAGLYLVVWGKSEESKLVISKAVTSSMFVNYPINSTGKSCLVQPLLTVSSE
ncbi:protein WALLS ARE THIN 1 [Ricinus communis]|uniref:WAT1-related protein n=1 Tax=Ricinus communis TaxID=3988 RepID=B9T7B7_RICCO|nr:protein WALLS ARE THIN 1 [Ricinus communis]EEF28253.1 Auxin-induced protein 5NG4, putative [Ricinus communis]|eukprot:XP_002534136.1 protein WALLS ARE THIN 1 [Ricinus communis]